VSTPPAGVLASEREPRPAEEPWWLAPPLLQRAIEARDSLVEVSVSYRLGDAVLQISSDDPALLHLFGHAYSDCAVPNPSGSEEARVWCHVRRSDLPPLVVLTFRRGAPPDPAGATFSLLRPTCAVPPYTVRDSPMPGWRLAGGAAGPILATDGTHVLFEPRNVPPDFLVEYLVGVTLAAQPELLPVHAASISIGGAGLLLVGNSHAGKTTTSLHLAARGHILLGDEVAPIRLTTNEIVPFRRAVNVRPGPHAPELPAPGDPRGGRDASAPFGGRWTGPHRIGQLFPGAPPNPVRLRAAFFLGGFADRPTVVPFRLALDNGDVSTWLATPEIAYASWGLTPERRALRLFTLKQVLARVPCWLLKLGAPVETAELIERTMEEL
jgi:hypothetical protein